MELNKIKYKIKIVKGDITKIEADAIVNDANSSLLGGSGVDGTIHKAGGIEILNECIKIRNKQGGCKTGEAVITTAGKLKAKYVIHTVGPIWEGGLYREAELLGNSYKNSLKLALEHNVTSIAFPSISTGVYGFPKMEATEIALTEVVKFLDNNNTITDVYFVCFDDETYKIFIQILKK